MTLFNRPATQIIGMLLSRIIVPLWVLSGALFKLIETSPRTLPKMSILNPAAHFGLDLYWLLAVLISLEFIAISVMFFIRPVARTMAIFMLTSFCLILLNEIRGGATSCGCLGTFSPPPWMMLSIDGVLLLGALIFSPKQIPKQPLSRLSIGAVIATITIGTSISFAVVIPAGRAPDRIPPGPTAPSSVGSAVDSTVNPSPKPLEGYWFVENIDHWVGKSWNEIELFQYMPNWPDDLGDGERYVVFYSRTCDHCEDMFWSDLIKPFDPPVIAIEIPADKETLTAANSWEMPESNCQLMNLPIGTDWIITAPLSLRIENGIITCAEEGAHQECLRLN